LRSWGVPDNWVAWRLLMVCAALPALLTFFIRLFVPESQSWEKERQRGATSSWASRDLLAVLAGACVCAGLLWVWQYLEGAAQRKEYSQLAAGFGAVVGTIAGALLAGWLGRRIVYVCLCVTALGAVELFYLGNTTFDVVFVLTVFLAGLFSAAFYGWLPLYLPELFPTRVRATGQGFGYNFGRILAAVGVLQLPALMGPEKDFARAGSLLALIYLVGLFVIWLAPEPHGQPLPD